MWKKEVNMWKKEVNMWKKEVNMWWYSAQESMTYVKNRANPRVFRDMSASM